MMRGAGKSDRPVVPEEPANEDENCLGRPRAGEACAGTPAETPETGKCKPDATPGGSNRAAEQVTELAPPARRFERDGATASCNDCGGDEGDRVRAAISRCG